MNPHVHCTLLPIKTEVCVQGIFAGKDKFEYSARMKQLIRTFSPRSTRNGEWREAERRRTGRTAQTTEEYRRMLSEECTTIEENIDRHQKCFRSSFGYTAGRAQGKGSHFNGGKPATREIRKEANWQHSKMT
nr:hypothetical protein [Parabacteroides johnsonii]